MIIEIKGASDGDAVFYLDIEKWERIIAENPTCKVTIEYGASPDLNSLLPNQHLCKR